MKAEVDLHFLVGVNQIIGHGWPYSAPQVGEPGWSLYAAAVFNDHNPWHPVMPDVTRYIERTSFLLRQGQPANQVALLLPTDDAWASFSPGKVSVTAEMDRLVTPAIMSSILSAGYNVDYIDADCHRQDWYPLPGAGHSANRPHPGGDAAQDSAVRDCWRHSHRGGARPYARRKWTKRS